ncbi:MAG: PEP-utilizing enzyme [Ilumatobacteraceae bacterium]
MLDSNDPSALEPGDILVAPITDPSWTPLFVPAGAVVVDVGAPLSHAIIVSRELGIPCVISATGATKRIPDGAWIRVDGSWPRHGDRTPDLSRGDQNAGLSRRRRAVSSRRCTVKASPGARSTFLRMSSPTSLAGHTPMPDPPGGGHR